MPKSPNQKLKLLYLKEYFERNTDEQHPVTTAELIAYLARQDIAAERKSLYDDIETLRAFGMDIVKERQGNVTGWYLGERTFQLPELRLLVDSVQSSRFITHKKSLELIEKIEGLTSTELSRGLRRQVWVKNRIKSMNESIYYIVDELHAAIAGDRQIRFHYFRYNAERKRELRHGGKWYAVSPFALLWDDENYYLIGFDNEAGILKHFRVDKMCDLRSVEKPREGKDAFREIDMAHYTDGHFSMFSGQTEKVKMEFRSDLSGAVIDRFGTDALLIPSREGYFTVTADVAVNEPFFGWLCSFGDGAKLLAPAAAADAMAKHIRSIAVLYEEETK